MLQNFYVCVRIGGFLSIKQLVEKKHKRNIENVRFEV